MTTPTATDLGPRATRLAPLLDQLRRIGEQLAPDPATAPAGERLLAALAAPGQPVVIAREQALALMAAGLHAQAEVVFDGLWRLVPEAPHGLVGLARLAEIRGQWRPAAARWQRLIALFPAGDIARWQVCRGRALIKAGEPGLAMQAFAEVPADSIQAGAALAGRVQALELLGHSGAALDLLTRDPLPPGDSRSLDRIRLRLLQRLRRWPEAYAVLVRLVQTAETVGHLEFLLLLRPAWTLQAVCRPDELAARMLQQLDALPPATAPADIGAHASLRLRLLLLGRDAAALRTCWQALRDRGHQDLIAPPLADAVARMAASAYPDALAPKVFGIGLSKTATSSLSAALGLLGYASVHWANPHTLLPLEPEDGFLFDALADTTISYRFEDYHQRFPNAQFIYTTRPLAGWVASLARHHLDGFGTASFADSRAANTGFPQPDQAISESLYFRHACAEDAYRAHDQRVRAFFAGAPAGKFLEFSIFEGQGWAELCAFLGCPVPGVPYPRENVTRAVPAARKSLAG